MQARVLLLGDSICTARGGSYGAGGYAPLVMKRLAHRNIAVEHFRREKWNTQNFLAIIMAGELPDTRVDLVHLNVGLHDLARKDEDSVYTVPLKEYEGNLRAIIAHFQAQLPATLVWASTTPVLDDRHERTKSFIRRDADVRRYNQIAAAVMDEMRVTTHDLYAVLNRGNLGEVLSGDGVHPTSLGREILADAVVVTVLDRLGLGRSQGLEPA